MTTHEPECVALKRVAQLLLGKSRQEELEFWSKRTELCGSQQKQEKPKLESGIT